MAVLKSPKNQSSKRTWIRLFVHRTKFLRFISKKAFYNRNFSVIPLKWNSIYTKFPAQPFNSPLENIYFTSYIYMYTLKNKKKPIKNSKFFLKASNSYIWSTTTPQKDTPFKPTLKVNWSLVPKLD